VPNFTKIAQEIWKTQIQTAFVPYVTYDCRLGGFQKTGICLTIGVKKIDTEFRGNLKECSVACAGSQTYRWTDAFYTEGFLFRDIKTPNNDSDLIRDKHCFDVITVRY
jgi:hypothetical protein